MLDKKAEGQMSAEHFQKASLKQKAIHEFEEFAGIFL